MRHIRDFFHNINDIVLAIVIVAAAAGIIYWRMQIIMDYPKQLVNGNEAVQEERSYDAAAAEEETQPGEEMQSDEDGSEQAAEGTQSEESEEADQSRQPAG